MEEASTALRTKETSRPAWILVERSANKAERLLDDWKYLLLLVCTACYAFITCYAARRKLFWFDEIFTVHISRLPSVRIILDALMNGADLNPPLLYILTHFSEAILGPGHLGARLPGIIGFWIFCLCLFRFVAIRSSALAGFISMSFPLITTAYLYAFEARSYGLVLGFCGLGLISWQALTSARKGRFWLALGLWASLSAALVTHSYAFLLFVPLVAGEIARLILHRRKDWLVWLALIGSGSAILLSLPKLLSARSLLRAGSDSFMAPSVTKLVEFYEHLLEPATIFIGFAVALICIDFLGSRKASGHPVAVSRNVGINEYKFQAHEKIVLFTFLTIPFFTYVASRLSGAPMMERYSLATVAGLAALLGMAAGKRAVIGSLVLILLSALLARQFMNFVHSVDMKEPASGLMISTSQGIFNQRYYWMSSGQDNRLPIVLLNNHEFAATFFYAPPELQSRLVYFPAWDNINAEGYKALQKCCGAVGKVANLDEILATTNAFLTYSSSSSYWKLDRFIETGGTISIRKIAPDYALFLVTYPSR